MRLASVVYAAEKAAKQLADIFPLASGGAPYKESTVKVIRFIRHGCANRPFFHIAVQEGPEEQYGGVIEQVGTYDPFPNKYNEKVVALNLIRIHHWLNSGAIMSLPVKKLLGLSGYSPIHPKTFREAWVRRKLLIDTLAELEAAASSKANAASTVSEDAASASESNNTPTSAT